MTRASTLLGFALTVLVAGVSPAVAQPQIVSPAAGQVFAAGPDFATDVLQDPWDFSNVDDVAPHPDDHLGWTESSAARSVGPSAFLDALPGRFKATSNSADPTLGLLYQGTATTVIPGRSGLRYPIDASRYRKLAFKMRVSNAAGSAPYAYWFRTTKPVLPGAIGQAASPSNTSIGEKVYQIDLTANASGAPYQGQILGLRLDPTSDVNAGIEIDWVRLTASDGPSAAMMNVATAGCSGQRTVGVVDGTVETRVLTDTSNNGSFNYGIFPPGTYVLRVACNSVTMHRTFTINDPPRITVFQPDERGGADYATTVLGNPWNFENMTDATLDVPLRYNVGLISSAPGMLRATSTGSSGMQLGDPQLFFLNGEGAARPIATSRFRYATFSLALNAPFTLSRADGSAARLMWASAAGGFDGTVATQTKDVLVWPGLRTYTVDLAQLSQAGGTLEQCWSASPPSCFPWTAQSARYFRIDPHEFGTRPVEFALGTVTLAAPDEVVQGETFRMQWSTLGAAAGSVSLYYDTDTNPSSGRQLIAQGLPIGSTFYNWSADAAPGDYYIYVEVTESIPGGGTDRRGAYSTGVLRVISAVNNPVVSIASHAAGGTAYSPFTISGCAHNLATGAPADEVIAHAIAGNVPGVLPGTTHILGFNAAGGLGTQSVTTCAGGPTGSGYTVTGIVGLPPGRWTLRVLARNTVTGDFDEVRADNVLVEQRAAPARNLRYVATGNQVRFQWDPPTEGRPIRGYRVEAAINPAFSPIAGQVVLPPHTHHLDVVVPNGTWYIRVITANDYSVDGASSNVINFTLPGGARVQPPGAVELAGRLTMNPVALSWAQAGGGAATYTLHAGSRSGASDIAIVPMGTQTSLPPTVVPLGVSIFVRIVASNPAGSSTSNEVVVNVPVPGPPGGPPIMLDPVVVGHHVTLRWNPPFGGAVPTSYALVARLPGSSAVIALLTGLTSTSLPIAGVPSGSYVVTVAALYGPTPSFESNPKTVVVP